MQFVSNTKTMMTDNLWYPAQNVVAHFEVDFRDIKTTKKADEMMAVAILVVIIQEMHQKQYWIQGVSDTEQSPDVRTIYSKENEGDKSPLYYQQDVEVVSYTQYSKNKSLADFVASTKLSFDKSYDELTTILVHVRTGIKFQSMDEWQSILSKTGKNNPVMVLGRINPDEPKYRLAIVHPVVEGAIDFNPALLLKKQNYDNKPIELHLGTKNKSSLSSEEKHCPFEKFGVNCRLLK